MKNSIRAALVEDRNGNTVRGTMKPQVTPGKTPFVFLGYANVAFLIETEMGTLRLAVDSVQLKQWEDGFGFSLPSHAYEDAQGERRHAQRVRFANDTLRVAAKSALLAIEEIAELSAAGADALAAAIELAA